MLKSVPPTQNRPGSGPWQPLRSRPLAIMLMLAGVIAFVVSRLVFGDQVLCLLGSTLITFAGLAMILSARRAAQLGGGQSQSASPRPSPVSRGSSLPRRVPSGLRSAIRQGTEQREAQTTPSLPEEPAVDDELPAPEPLTIDPASLLGRAIATLEAQGAQVVVDTRREDRAILRVQSQGGNRTIALVLESSDPVDVADVRALSALIANSDVAGGYLVACANFTQRAVDVAGVRNIQLVQEDQLNDLRLL